MLRNFPLFPVLLLSFAACGGGGGTTATSSPVPSEPGSVHVVVDTATGTDALVQFQVAAATLQRADGSTTGNLLPAPEMVTLADPSGEADGLTLRAVPTGDYAALHLLLVPGSGAMLRADGTVVPVASGADLTVPLTDGLQHSAVARSWIEIGHNGAQPPAAAATAASWSPAMSGRAPGGASALAGLRTAVVQGTAVTALWAAGDDGPVALEFAAGCTFTDDAGGAVGSREDFLRGLSGGDDLSVDGDLHRDGRFVARGCRRHGRGNDGPRLLGRIVELRPAAETFLMDVQAEVRSGNRRLLPRPERVLVHAANARMHWSHSPRTLTFAELQQGQLAKVEWTRRAPGTSGLEEVVARQIEITSGPGEPMRPEWEGAVRSVDLNTNVIVVVPRGNDPILVRGQSVRQVDVQVLRDTHLERRERRGPGRTRITLGDIVPGQDRIWWRGTVTGPASIDATWVRVRLDN